jgi:hypothetical protein
MGIMDFSVIKVPDFGLRERFTEYRHTLMPLFIPDHREFRNIGEMSDGKLGIHPKGAGIPAMETGHIEEHVQLSVLSGKAFDLRHKMFIISLCQFARVT